ncbi:uncharacterized protein tespa1 isoform X1 [Syngnathus acus]|uniref:uncharacterized protein tespa1 isoform X1 n=1 Tax=Syngnathus acus TaxID=161584 RepID=UPI001885E364|nr:uncharacterized protein tespa1 isoform X1 [Syngnathus acus]
MWRVSSAKIANILQDLINHSDLNDGKSVLHCQKAKVASGGQQCSILEEVGPLCSFLSESLSDDDDDVFADGCFTGKAEFLQQNHRLEPCLHNNSLWSLDSALSGGDVPSKVGLAMHPSSKRRHNDLSSNIPEVLQSHSVDAEEILWQLGFGCDDPQPTVRIPPRFLSFPSQARGINFRLFLESQVRRMREEDPTLCLASRFRQVQALTAMANAFYSLYSHVSGTPLLKLGTPQFTLSPPTESVRSNLRSSVRTEPRSPVERLKDTVSKMCLYTSPRTRSSLPDLDNPVPQQVQNESKNVLGEEDCSLALQVGTDTHAKQNDSVTIEDELKQIGTVTYEILNPKIVECVRQANALHHVFPEVSSDVCQYSIDICRAKIPKCIKDLKKCDEGLNLDSEMGCVGEEETARETPIQQIKGGEFG